MNRRGRILVIDDDLNWREEVTEILQREGYYADSAATYDEALERVNDVNYHVLVVDIRMKETDPTNEDGIKLLKELQKRGSNEATQVIMLSAHGTKERTRTAFREYQVADFLYKEEFNRQMFLDSVRQVFVEKVKINLALDIRWQGGNVPEQAAHNLEVEGVRVMHGTILHSQVTAELEDLLCRLFHTARSILVRPLRPDKSGTGILWVQPFYATGGGGYEVAVKFGDFRLIEQEYSNFKQFVQPFLGSGHNAAIQEFRRTPRLGGVIYSFLGTAHDQLTDFGEFYRHSASHQICDILDRLFHSTCGTWYANRGDLQLLDLTADYQRLLSEDLDALEQIRFKQLTTVPGHHNLFFTSLINHRDRSFTNPILALTRKTLVRPTYVSITHGDLHHGNIFVDTSGRVWLIDFQETAQSHILRDVAILDSVIRFQLLAPGEATLEERLQMEEALCSIERFSQLDGLSTAFTTQNQALAKAYESVVHLRMQARKLVELHRGDDMSEYYIALLYIAVNTIGFSSLALIQREHALLSASLLADRLELKEQDQALGDKQINEIRSAIASQSFRNYSRHEEALVAYEKAIILDPRDAVAYYNKSVILKKLKRNGAALEAYKQAIMLDPLIAELDIVESPQDLLIRLQSVQQFLTEAGFELNTTSNQVAFIATPKTPIWNERFPKGVYVQILFDDPLDQSTVQSIFCEAKAYTDCAFVIINQQPKSSGWMAIGGLRAEEHDRFVFLPIEEPLIKKGIALKNEHQTLSFYVNKYLGEDFNPYDVRDPVSDAVSFFGRESLTDEILRILKLGRSLGLFGLHKMGKSSVLLKLQKIAEFPVAYIYLKETGSLDSIFNAILANWAIDTKIKFPNLGWSLPTFSENRNPKIVFEASAKELLTLLRGVTNTPLLAIFLDEIEKIMLYKDGNETAFQLYVNLMDSVRGLQHETNGLSLLVAGVHPIVARHNYIWGNQKNPMHQVISERFLRPLDRDDCTQMICSLGQQISLTYSDDVLEYIVQMSGAHPFLARQICSIAYNNRGNIDTFSIEYLQEVARKFIRNPATASYFDDYGLWAELGKHYIWGEDVSNANYKILSSLAASSTGLNEYEVYSGLNKQTAIQALNGLKERGIISFSEEGSSYYITFGLFRDWIRLHKLGLE